MTKMMEINGVHLNVSDEGSGEVILLLHGFPDSLKVWRHMVPILVDAGYRVISYDQRGFGDSDAPQGVENYKIKHLLNDLDGVLAALGVDGPFKLVGHDWGSSIGWAYAIKNPQRVSSFVSIGTGHPTAYHNDGGFDQLQRKWYIFCFLFEGTAEQVFMDNDAAVFRIFCAENPDLESHCVPDMQRPGRFTAGLNWYRANILREVVAKPLPGKVSVPVLGIISSGDEKLNVAQMESSGDYMEEGKWSFEVMSGCGHWIPLEKPQELATRILDYYRK